MRSGKGERFNDLAEVESYLRAACQDFGPLSDEQWKHVVGHSVEAIENGGYALAWDPGIVTLAAAGGNQEGVEYGSGFLHGVDLWPVWNAVRCPTLVLRASESAVLSAGTAERMRASGAHVRVVEVPGVGHAPWLMSPEQIGLVRDFLFAPDASESR
jgi:pimeloyl-ACP methyl ester carboxylesterase